jgi:hypothetical protein
LDDGAGWTSQYLKNGYFNLGVKSIWIGIVATSSDAKVTETDINPMAGFFSDGDF